MDVNAGKILRLPKNEAMGGLRPVGDAIDQEVSVR